jgi:hypothetical protein
MTTQEIIIAALEKEYSNWDIIDTVTDLHERWLDKVGERNNSKAGSAKYRRASDAADALERYASLLAFGDEVHTMLECINGEESA